jgi:hypothetical protein
MSWSKNWKFEISLLLCVQERKANKIFDLVSFALVAVWTECVIDVLKFSFIYLLLMNRQCWKLVYIIRLKAYWRRIWRVRSKGTWRRRRGGRRHWRHPQVHRGGAPVATDGLRCLHQGRRSSCWLLFSQALTYQVISTPILYLVQLILPYIFASKRAAGLWMNEEWQAN